MKNTNELVLGMILGMTLLILAVIAIDSLKETRAEYDMKTLEKAAAVREAMRVVNERSPQGVKAVGIEGMVRNCIDVPEMAGKCNGSRYFIIVIAEDETISDDDEGIKFPKYTVKAGGSKPAEIVP